MYDPSIARWNGVDIQADTFLSLSPYIYVSNSPLKLIDPNGEEIWVTDGNGNQYQYRRGNFINDQGEVVSTKNNSFLRKTRNALRAIQYSGGAQGNKLVTDLSEKTDFDISINYVRGGAAYSGGQIGFDPSIGLLNENGEILSPAGVLSHELGHGFSVIFENNSFRNRDATNWYMRGGDPYFSDNEEKEVIRRWEQPIALAMGQPFRRKQHGLGEVIQIYGDVTSTRPLRPSNVRGKVSLIRKRMQNPVKYRNDRYYNTFFKSGLQTRRYPTSTMEKLNYENYIIVSLFINSNCL